MLKLYDCSTAPSPRRARMFLAEKGLEWETVEVDLRNREQLGEAFLALNPRATVPVLETPDGEIIADNIGIAAYVEALHPDPPLMGTTPLEKARVLAWDQRCMLEGLSAIAEVLRNGSPHLKGRALPGPRDLDQIPDLADRGRKRLGWFFEDVEAHLSDRDHLASDRYSLADITLTVAFDFSKWVKAQPGDDHPHLQRYMARMRERPSYGL
ncbi:glutathione S-transferase family protein [uncultured Algimonas sp.]|uniref:glutathione S-transferase family protein n=1 Tax=uncultured Algimonas sp. TaxID=1547920 RepID=UPI00262ACECC|nr:glutathione S-transferase family protein [uncultured Algimonas sp.]